MKLGEYLNKRYNTVTNKAFAEGLRKIADLYEQHPDLPQFDRRAPGIYVEPEAFKDVVRKLGSIEKLEDDSNFFTVIKMCGPIMLEFFTSKEAVCKARVVGKRHVPELVIQGTPDRVIPEHDEDVIEWDCESLLKEPANADSKN